MFNEMILLGQADLVEKAAGDLSHSGLAHCWFSQPAVATEKLSDFTCIVVAIIRQHFLQLFTEINEVQ